VVNEAYGFEVGDEVVVEAGRRLSRVARAGDAVARYSGSKFGLILNRCAEENLAAAAERFLRSVRESVIDTGAGPVWALLSVGAVVLMHLAAIAGRFFDHAEIIEYHRDRKADAPSGTAAHTARLMQRARGDHFVHSPSRTITLDGVRGGESGGIGIHSVRLPGLVAHQEVILGGLGQTLTLRHDATSNDSYVPGAVLAIKHAAATTGLTVGLGALLGLEP